MDNFKPEDDLKPDTSDRRRPVRRRPSPSAPKFFLPRQHMMLGLGIIVLLVLIIGIGSALKAPTQHETAQKQNGPKEINLSGSSLSGSPATTGTGNNVAANNNAAGNSQAQNVSMPPISNTPTDAAPQPARSAQQRVELPGNMADALTQQQGQVNTAAQNLLADESTSTLPTAPATLAASADKGRKPTTATTSQPPATASHTKPQQPAVVEAHRQTPPPVSRAVEPPTTANRTKPATSQVKPAENHTAHAPTTTANQPVAATKPAVKAAEPAKTGAPIKTATSSSESSVASTPASHFTLQLSGASRSDTLQSFAKQQNLNNYQVYKTSRDGKPWYVLVSGSYSSAEEAKQAITALPAEVQAKNPWVRPVQQVQQDPKK